MWTKGPLPVLVLLFHVIRVPGISGHVPSGPTLDIVMLVHPYNKLSVLPFSLGGIGHQQDFPKHQINLIFRVGVYGSQFVTSPLKYNLNQRTLQLLYRWVDANEKEFHKVVVHEDMEEVDDEEDRDYWTRQRFAKVMQLRQRSLQASIEDEADFVLMLDADVILTNRQLLTQMVMKAQANVSIVAPMLDSLGTYSNFWGGISEKGYYVRTTEYMELIERTKRGTFAVPMIHSCVLIDLRDEGTHALKFSPDPGAGNSITPPFDDIISFAFCARHKAIRLFVNNDHVWGYILPAVDGIANQFQQQELIDLQLEALLEGPEFPVGRGLQPFVQWPEPEKLAFDRIYVINLKRRVERRTRMEKTLKVIGLEAEFWDATDGRNLSVDRLRDLGVSVMPGYADPYHKRPMTMGEIGCFLSHYAVWQDVIDRKASRVIVLEDDVRFERNFKHRLREELRQLDLNSQDLIYLGRKRQTSSPDDELRLFANFVRPRYSYWTIGYIVTRTGAEKLLRAQPLKYLLPVDEFLPIMYDQHPNQEWSRHFPTRDLRALSIDPLVVSPTHYVGDQEYISDTEDSDKISLSAHHPKLQSPPSGHRHSEL